MDYNKIIILVIAVIVVIIVAGTVFLMDPFREESKVVIITNDTVHAGNTFLFELTDLKDNPIANANVSISIRDNNSRIIVNEHLIETNKLTEHDYSEILEAANENLLKHNRIALSEIKPRMSVTLAGSVKDVGVSPE